LTPYFCRRRASKAVVDEFILREKFLRKSKNTASTKNFYAKKEKLKGLLCSASSFSVIMKAVENVSRFIKCFT